jgi:hypothetical protein
VSVRGRLSERERETEMRARVVNRLPPTPALCCLRIGPQICSSKKKRERERKRSSPDFGQILPESGWVSPELLFEEYFGEKKIKSGHVHCSVGQRWFD